MSNSTDASTGVDHPGDSAPKCEAPRVAVEPLSDRGLAALGRLLAALKAGA